MADKIANTLTALPEHLMPLAKALQKEGAVKYIHMPVHDATHLILAFLNEGMRTGMIETETEGIIIGPTTIESITSLFISLKAPT